jgi:glycogen debranching enzyme
MKKNVSIGLVLAAALALTAQAASDPVPPAKQVAGPSPSLSVSGSTPAYWEDGFHAVYKTLLKNLHGPNLAYETRYAYPSPTFRGVYLWDTAFIAQVWRPWDPATAREVDDAVLIKAAPDGRLPHYAGAYGSSDYTQPPVMTWSVWRNFQRTGDKDYLARVYPVLKNYNAWLYRERRLPCGLFFWLHPYESGIDNSPRFGSADESQVVDMPKLAAVDLCSFIVRQNRTLALMAAELGIPDEALEFDAKADELAQMMNEQMWDPATGLYYDRDTASGQLSKIKTIASLFPLFAGVPNEEQATTLIGHIMNPAEFNTPIPLPSVARDDPTFEKDCWRGPMWLNTAYVVVVGMEDYGYRQEAALISWKLVDGVYKTYANTGKLVEFYDPDRFDFVELHRKQGNLYKQITLGGKPRPNFVGWTGLANTLLIEHLMGCRIEGSERRLAPNFPPEAQGASFKLTVPHDDLEIELEVKEGGRAQGRMILEGKDFPFDLEPGEWM